MSNRSGGFVLIEVMLAILVLTGSMVFVSQSFRTSMQTVRQSRDLFAAALLLESRIAELHKTGRWNPGSSVDPILGAVSWDDSAEPSEEPRLIEHRLTLAWGEGKRANSLKQSVYVWQ